MVFFFIVGIFDMNDQLLQKLEEKMLLLLDQVETLRLEVQKLQQENHAFKNASDMHTKKVQDLIALLETLPIQATDTLN